MITIYGNQLCVWCRKAKKLTEQFGIPHTWKDTDDAEIKAELESRAPDSKTIPQIWWNDRYIGGYTDLAQEIENTAGGFGDGAL